ncbi:MAG: hypothetical protein JXB49_10345 [Bacteroidales bacterium]|nr:hypothetical protein [Bacteroidales bacterium]
MKTKSIIHLVGILVIIMVCLGCKKDTDDDDTDDNCNPANFSGMWYGTWTSNTAGVSGTFAAHFVQDASNLTGTIDVPEIGLSNAPLSGKICGNEISFGDIDGTISFSGAMDTDSTVSGTYKYPELGDKGVWQGTNNTMVDGVLHFTEKIVTRLNQFSDDDSYIFYKHFASDGNNMYVSAGNVIFQFNEKGEKTDSLNYYMYVASDIDFNGQNLIVAEGSMGTNTIYQSDGFSGISIKGAFEDNLNGITNDGTNLWVADYTYQNIYFFKQSITGEKLDSFIFNIEGGPGELSGITCDGTSLWLCESFEQKVIQVDLQGNILKELDYPFGEPNGIEYVNGSFYFSDVSDHKIYHTDMNLNLLDTLHSPVYYPGDLAFDGTCLWVLPDSRISGDDQSAYKIQTNGTLLNEIDIPGNPSRPAFTFLSNSLWYGCGWNSILYKINPNGSTCKRIPEDVYFTGIEWDAGILWYCDDFDGKLIVYDLDGNKIFEKDLEADNMDITWDGNNIWMLTYTIIFEDDMEEKVMLQKLNALGEVLLSYELNINGFNEFVFHKGAFYVLKEPYFFDPYYEMYKYEVE